MKHLQEINRIKEIMSLINEGEGLKYLERLLTKGTTSEIRKAETVIDDIFRALDLDGATITKLEQLGIRDATDLTRNLSSLSEDLASNVAKSIMRSSSDYSKMFYNMLKNNDYYDESITAILNGIENNSKRFNTQEKVNKAIDKMAEMMRWPDVVTFNLKSNIKPKVDVSKVFSTVSTDAPKFVKVLQSVVGGEENYKFFVKWLGIILGGSAIAGVGLWNLGPKALEWWDNRGNDPQFMDDELIKKIINGSLDSDFATYFNKYEDALSSQYKTVVSTVLTDIKQNSSSNPELKLSENFIPKISDGFHLKYILDQASEQGFTIPKEDLIDDVSEGVSKPFYMYKPLSSINVEEKFRVFEAARQQLLEKYTSLEKKCEGQDDYVKVDLSSDPTDADELYRKVNEKVIAYLINKEKSSAASAIGIIDDKAKSGLGIDISTGPSNEDELKTQINKILGESTELFPDLNTCSYKYSFQTGITENKKSLGLVEILKKNGVTEQFGKNKPKPKAPGSQTKKPAQTTTQTTPTQTTPTQTTVDPKIKELQNYLSVIYFYSPNKVKITLKLTKELYNDVLDYFEGLKDSEPNITLLQALILFLIESNDYNISNINVPMGYQKELDMLISENLISKVKGLKNILLEQLTPDEPKVLNIKRVSYVVNNGKIQKPSSQGTKQPSTAGQPTGPLLPPKTSTVQTPEIKKPSEIKLKPEERKMIPQNTTTQLLSDNKNIQKIKYYSDLIKTTDKPNYKLCDNLFDNYESEIKLLKKQIEQGLIEPPKGDEPVLNEIKQKLKWCYTSSQEKWRFKFKFSQLSSMRDDKIEDKSGAEIDNPFKVNI